MKSNLALIALAALALSSCDKKEEVTQSAKPSVTKPKPARPAKPAPLPEPTPPEPAPSNTPEITQAAAAPEAPASPSTAAPETAAPQTAQSTTGKTTEQLRAERLERMAKAREERTAQMTAQLTTRFKEQDANGDGFLSKDEAGDRMQRYFGQADKNSDGFLDAAEQQAMIQTTSQRFSDAGRMGRNGQGGGFNRQGRGNRNP